MTTKPNEANGPLFELGRSVHDDVLAYRAGFCHGLHQLRPLPAAERCASYNNGYRRASSLRADTVLHVPSDDQERKAYQAGYRDGRHGNEALDEYSELQYLRGHTLGRIAAHLENTDGEVLPW